MSKTTSTRTQRRPNGSAPDPVRSVRCSDAKWEAAKRRARHEGVTMSQVLSLIIEGYAQDAIDLPTLSVTYAQKVPTESVA